MGGTLVNDDKETGPVGGLLAILLALIVLLII
jgi:hypothetical protein